MRQFTKSPNGYIPNPDYDPAACGLEMVAYCGEGGYSWDRAVVYRDTETGALFFDQDAGCSCSSPCENFTGLDDFTPISSWGDFEAAFQEKHSDSYSRYDVKEVADFRDRVRTAIDRLKQS